MSNPLPSLLALTSIADGGPQQAAPIRNNYSAVQTAVNSLITALSGGAVGQVLQAVDSTHVQWSARTTVASLSGGPPGAPSDGDIWIATNVDGNGARWQFQYNAGSASAFKWEFIGGFPQSIGPAGSITTSSAAPVDLTGGPSLTLARAGDYMVEFGVNATSQVAGANNMTTFLNVAGVNQSQANGLNMVATAQFQGGQQSTEIVVPGVAAATTLKLQVESQNSLSTTFQGGWIKATPRRIS